MWKRIRQNVVEAARHACQLCADAPSPLYGDPLTCHEVWRYDDKRRVATLEGFRAQCPKCDSAVHLGLAMTCGAGNKAIAQLRKVNGIGLGEAERLCDDAFAEWKSRSKKKWRIRVAKLLLEKYPALARLTE